MDERDLIEKLKKEIADTFDNKLVNSKVVKEKIKKLSKKIATYIDTCLLYTSPSPRDS